MKAGLLGALKGFGEGIEEVGSSIQKRREQALEDARELAKEQRRQAIRQEERAEDRGLRIDLAEATITAADRRLDKSQAGMNTRQAASQRFTQEQNEWKEQSAERLIKIRDKYARSRTAASQANAAAIQRGQVRDVYTDGHAVKRPDGELREQILHEMGDGTIVKTGQWVKPGTSLSPPKNRSAAKGGSMLDQLNLDEDPEDKDDD